MLAAPFGKAAEVRDRRLRFGESQRVAHLVDMLPHSLAFCSLAVLFSARAGFVVHQPNAR
eukprot:8507260-Pyramimonas_sp.AAC.1